jgi:hypothetical protein
MRNGAAAIGAPAQAYRNDLPASACPPMARLLKYACKTSMAAYLSVVRARQPEMAMNNPAYRIESTQPIVATRSRSCVQSGSLLASRELAVSLAAKCFTSPPGGEIRVVHVPTGEVLFRKTSEWGGLRD